MDNELKIKSRQVYTHSFDYAEKHGEIENFYDSLHRNKDCARAIDGVIAAYYSDNKLNTADAKSELVERFGIERVSWVLANTVQFKDDDGRFSSQNKAWASSFDIPKTEDGRQPNYIADQSHPGLVDLLINRVRKDLEQSKDSIADKIKTGTKKAAEHTSTTKKNNGWEL